jgi:hypothetical protein
MMSRYFKSITMKRIKALCFLTGIFCMNLILLAICFGPVWSCLFSCTDITNGIVYDVEPSLVPAANFSFEQAAIRGVKLYKDNLLVQYGTDQNNDNGLCSWDGTICIITINNTFKDFDKTSACDEVAMEYIMLHEFGHWMGRRHCNTYSIMNPNKYAGNYHTDTVARKKLIDELFLNK